MFFFPPPSFSSSLSFHPIALTLSSDKRHKETKKCHNQRVLMFRLYSGWGGADSQAVLPYYSRDALLAFPLCSRSLSVWPCHLSISSLLSLSLAVCFYCLSLSWSFLSLSLCFFLFTRRSSPVPMHPRQSCNNSGRAIRPISPISRC